MDPIYVISLLVVPTAQTIICHPISKMCQEVIVHSTVVSVLVEMATQHFLSIVFSSNNVAFPLLPGPIHTLSKSSFSSHFLPQYHEQSGLQKLMLAYSIAST